MVQGDMITNYTYLGLMPVWSDALKLAVRWYVEGSTQAGGVEGAIALTQVALESLAWTLIVEDKQILDKRGFESLDASNRLSLLLSQLGIPLAVPGFLSDLTKFAKSRTNANGPQSLTGIRNMVVHANYKNLQKVLEQAPRVREQAWYLGLQYLELALLHLCGCRDV